MIQGYRCFSCSGIKGSVNKFLVQLFICYRVQYGRGRVFFWQVLGGRGGEQQSRFFLFYFSSFYFCSVREEDGIGEIVSDVVEDEDDGNAVLVGQFFQVSQDGYLEDYRYKVVYYVEVGDILGISFFIFVYSYQLVFQE